MQTVGGQDHVSKFSLWEIIRDPGPEKVQALRWPLSLPLLKKYKGSALTLTAKVEGTYGYPSASGAKVTVLEVFRLTKLSFPYTSRQETHKVWFVLWFSLARSDSLIVSHRV